LMEDLRTREPEPEPEIWYEDGIPNIRVRPQGVAPKPAKVAQAKTGTTTDAVDPLEQLRLLSQGERLDDAYAKTLERRQQDEASRWFSQFAEQSGTPLTPEQPAGAGQPIPGVMNPLQLPGVMQHGASVAKDIGKGIFGEAHKTTLGAALKNAASALDLIDQAATWLNNNVYADPRGGQFDPATYKGADLAAAVPNIAGSMNDPETVTGNILQGISRFLMGYGLAGKATGIGNSFGGSMVKGAMSDFTMFQGQEANLATLIQSFPALQNPISEYLATNEDTPEIEGRLKNALTGAGAGALLQPLILGLRGLREARRVKELTGAETYAEAADKLAKGGVGPGEGATPAVGGRVEQLLGNPSDPLVTQIQGKLRPIDYGVDDGTAAKSLADAQGADGAPSGFSNDVKVNFARIDNPDDVKAVIGAMADAQAPEIDAVRRGVRTNAQTADAAGDENAWKLILGKRVGNLPRAEEQLAMRQLWAASGQKLMEVAKAAEVGGVEELYAFRRMMAVHNTIQQEVLGVRTETARALQQWRIPAGGDAEKLSQLQSVLTNSGGGENVSRELARRIAVLAENPEWAGAVDEMVRKGAFAKTSDAVREVWINAILSGPKTHIVNMMSNTGVVAQSIAERAIAGRMGDLLHPVEGVKIGEALAMWQGIRESLKDAFVYAARAARTGETGHWNASTPGQLGFDIGKLEGQRTRAISSEAIGMPDTMLAKGVDMLGEMVTLPGRALGAEDEFFKTINYRAELGAQAHRQAAEEVERGLLPKEKLKERKAELYSDPPENLRLKAADFALYNTFNNEAGTVAQQIMKLRDAIPGGYFVVPFIRTPANILKYTFERTPLAPVSARMREDIAAGGARRDLAMAKMGLGTMVATVAFDMALDGHLTGSGPDGDKGAAKRALMRRSGWQPYSVRVPTGEDKDGKPVYRYYAYNRMDPIGLQVGFAAEMAEFMRNKDGPKVDAEFEEIFAATALSAAQNVMDKAYMRGFSDLVDALKNPERKGESYFTRIGSSFVPTGVKEWAQYMDPVARQTHNMITALKARTPGLSKDLPPKKDFWGKEVSYSSGLGSGYDAFSPIYSKSTDKAEPVDREFYGLNYAPTHPGFFRLENKSISLRNMPEAKNRFIDLSSATPASELIRDNMDGLVTKKGRTSAVVRHLEGYGDKTMLQTLNSLVKGELGQQSLDYKAADPDEKVKMLRDIMRNYHQAAKVQVLREFPRIKELRAEIPDREMSEEAAPF
jgi:hypothetical protein